ncbi:hypothetical protein CONCODRAFT_7373 [Conidiobolus coronatus NRRL 28638]|uniref:Uncharacterized protein n=1 Tax=Conidiobolus coronatus (strain ATCC 28846 / CBS 209.66 / NRRL 28638) TaxID=796925 RepID=A0A137P5D2_CONC2|nr:hypothetical protein CONCODRAFT_7373 [Conidiobolus coronatus NRRL 28638]|eukprot:KXN70131.1 hypothetical protein CONCODRAFT_7373 [Conidiobolus coronatus NRRL 28638]
MSSRSMNPLMRLLSTPLMPGILRQSVAEEAAYLLLKNLLIQYKYRQACQFKKQLVKLTPLKRKKTLKYWKEIDAFKTCLNGFYVERSQIKVLALSQES